MHELRKHKRLQLMSMIRLLLTAALVAVVLLGSSWLQATVIVMIQTNDGYWIGADGVRASKVPNPKRFARFIRFMGGCWSNGGESILG